MDEQAIIDGLGQVVHQGYGWMSPDGLISACTLNRHVRALVDTGFQPEWASRRIIPMLDAVEQAHDEFAETGNGWHDYRHDDMDDNVADEGRALVRTAYAQGWLRLGFMGSTGAREIHAEGLNSVLLRHQSTLEGCSRALGYGYKPTPFAQYLNESFVITGEQIAAWSPVVVAACQEVYGSLPAQLRMDWHTILNEEAPGSRALHMQIMSALPGIAWHLEPVETLAGQGRADWIRSEDLPAILPCPALSAHVGALAAARMALPIASTQPFDPLDYDFVPGSGSVCGQDHGEDDNDNQGYGF